MERGEKLPAVREISKPTNQKETCPMSKFESRNQTITKREGKPDLITIRLNISKADFTALMERE
jgi:hypothetical protein